MRTRALIFGLAFLAFVFTSAACATRPTPRAEIAAAEATIAAARATQVAALEVIQQATQAATVLATPITKPSPTREVEGIEAGSVLHLPGDDPATLDPHLATDATSVEYIVEIFSGLVTLNPDLEIVPDIAERWDVSEDGRTYTFYLHKDVRFQNGDPVTAQDFKWSIERACDPDTNSPVASLYLNDIVGAMDKLNGQADEVRGVRVIDDYTLEITIDVPKAYFLAKLTSPTAFVLDRGNVEGGGRAWTDYPNGTGPFRLAEYRLGERIVLERNPYYYREPKPRLEKVEFTLAGGSAMIMYENGELDATPVGLSDIERVTDPNNPLSAELTVVEPTLSVFYIEMNNAMPPFDDVEVRQAFNHAIDKQLLVDVVLRKTRRPAKGILPPKMPGYNPDLKGLDFDVEKAKQLIAESKYGSVENLPEITLSVSGGGAAAGPITTAIQGMLEQNLGIKINVELVESATSLSEASERKYQMYLLGWSADYPDPEDFLDILFHSESANNRMNYSNPEVDRLLEEARVEQDHERRMQLYQQAEQMIINDASWVPLFYSAEYWLTKPYVKGMIYPPAVIPKLKYVSIEQSAAVPATPTARPSPTWTLTPSPTKTAGPTSTLETPTPGLEGEDLQVTITPTKIPLAMVFNYWYQYSFAVVMENKGKDAYTLRSLTFQLYSSPNKLFFQKTFDRAYEGRYFVADYNDGEVFIRMAIEKGIAPGQTKRSQRKVKPGDVARFGSRIYPGGFDVKWIFKFSNDRTGKPKEVTVSARVIDETPTTRPHKVDTKEDLHVTVIPTNIPLAMIFNDWYQYSFAVVMENKGRDSYTLRSLTFQLYSSPNKLFFQKTFDQAYEGRYFVAEYKDGEVFIRMAIEKGIAPGQTKRSQQKVKPGDVARFGSRTYPGGFDAKWIFKFSNDRTGELKEVTISARVVK